MTPAPANPLVQRARALRPAPWRGVIGGLVPLVVAVALALALHFYLRPLLPAFYPRIILDIGVNVILAVSLTMVNGFTGQFSLGHAAFMAVGAYTAACIVYYGSFRIWGDPYLHGGAVSGLSPAGDSFVTGADALFLLAILAGGSVAALAGALVGLPSLRLRGDYLAIVTLGFGEIVRVLIQSQTTDTLYMAEDVAAKHWWQLPKFLGGPVGFTGLPFYTSLFWVWVFAIITLVVAYRLKESTFGRAFLSIREDEIAAEAMGVKTTRYKVHAFVIAAFFAGIAGGLYAHTIGIQLNAGELAFMKSFDIIIMVVLGGMGSISGAAIAAAILSVLPEALRDPPPVTSPVLAGLIILGAVLILLFTERKLRGLIMLALAVAAYSAIRQGALVAGIKLSDYRMILYALALILMMILRPQGLFGVREIWSAWRIRPWRPRRDRAGSGPSGVAGKEPVS